MSVTNARIKSIISSTVKNVLCAPSRLKQKQLQMNRFLSETTKVFRSLSSTHIDVISVDMQMLQIAQKFGAYLNHPLEKIDPVVHSKITDVIFTYLNLFVEDGSITLSPKNVTVFTAVVCDKFSSGWIIKDKVVIPKIGLFAKHAPPEIAYSTITELDIVCRAMSSLKRQMQSTIIGSSNHTPKLKYCMRL